MTREIDVKAFTKDLPVVKSCCPANKLTHREKVKDFIQVVGKDLPNVREMIFSALIHPERYNLFDKYENEIDNF